MITISIDEAVAYDMLAILMLKQESSPTPVGLASCARLDSELSVQIGPQQHAQILSSDEYAALLRINRHVYQLLVRLNTEGPWPNDALDIDQLNYQRYPIKQALQKRFFPNAPLTERKTY